MKRIGIIGAGRFGMALAESLSNAGREVIVIDRNRPAMQSATEFATALQGDATQPHVLEEAGFGECDLAVVAIGSNVEASIMATANCKELRIPNVVSKASSELHGMILRRVGADSVIYPDRDSANRLARSIVNHNGVDFFEVSDGYSIAEIDPPSETVGKSLVESGFRKATGLSILCIKRPAANPGELPQTIVPQPTEVLHAGDKIVAFGQTSVLDSMVRD